MKSIKYFFAISLSFIFAGILYGGLISLSFIRDLPKIYSLQDYEPNLGSKMYDKYGRLIARFSSEDREFIKIEDVPEKVQQAFVAAEDDAFFSHQGIDPLGILRAAFANIKAGAKVQGGSTITQQVAKSFLSREKTFTRKLKDVLLAILLEQRLSKNEILYIYLNEIFFGDGSYGIQSASRRYFNKDTHELNIGEMALLAGLPQAPSRYSPRRNPGKALKRMNYVLKRMYEEKFISQEEYDSYKDKLPEIKPIKDFFTTRSPYFAETVRKQLSNSYGKEQIFEEGLNIYTTVDIYRHIAARKALWEGLIKVQKRRGLKGPILTFSEKEINKGELFLKHFNQKYGLYQKDYRLVTIKKVDKLWAKASDGKKTWDLPYFLNFWIREPNTEKYYEWHTAENLKERLKKGQVFYSKIIKRKNFIQNTFVRFHKQIPRNKKFKEALMLVEFPETQGAVISSDKKNGYLITAVGGSDFKLSQFNRALQGCRQPGSNFKPFVYGKAIESGSFHPASKLLDTPIYFEEDTTIGKDDKQRKEVKAWKPSNFGKNVQGEVLLREGLARSINLPTIYLLKKAGIPNVIEFAQKLGIRSRLTPDLSLALGSSCVKPMELLQAFTNINNLGQEKPIFYIKKVRDRRGNLLMNKTHHFDILATPFDIFESLSREISSEPNQLIPAKTAYILSSLLRNVVQEGTGKAASWLPAQIGGKTGTTNDSFDAWFSGFTRQITTTSWTGYDSYQQPLNKYETGGRASLPIWINYMKVAIQDTDRRAFKRPEGIIDLWIHPKTGKMVKKEDIVKVLQAFDVEHTPPKDEPKNLGELYEEEENLYEDLD